MTNPPLVTPEIRARAIAERRARDRQRREAPPEPARENPYACYRTTPVLFAVERLHVEERTLIWGANGTAYEDHTWDGTEEPIAAMLEGIADGLDVAVSSGTGLGKSFALAVLSMWFLACWENSLVFSFAPKEDQLRLFSWSEMRQLMPAFREMFPEATLTDLCLRIRGGQDDSWSAHGYPVGVSAADKKTSGGVATKAQGMHSAHMLLLYEEGPGIPQAVLEAGENTCTAPHNLRAIVGNPTSKLDTLYTFAHDFRGRVRPGVKAIRMSAHDHPNIVCRDASIVPGAASVESVRRRAAKYGTDHILYKSRIQGIAPSDAKDSLIKLEWIRRAQVRWAEPDSRRVLEAVGKGRRSMGVDVANSEGGDDGARARGKGAVLLEVEAAPCPNANELGFKVHLEMEREHIEAQHVGVDDVGVGAGCVNELRRLKHVIRELGGGDAPDGSDGVEQFVNLRGQMLWELAEDFRFDRIAIPPDDDELVADLVLYTYETRGSKIWVHPKEEMKEILGRSPNKGDAVMMWNHVRPRDIVADKAPSAEKGKTLTLEQQVYRDIQSLGKPKRSRYTPWTG